MLLSFAMRRLTLLLVEDDAGLRALLLRLLDTQFDILWAESGETAISLIESNCAIDLAITDFELQGVASGLDVAIALRKKFPSAPIILITGTLVGRPEVQRLLSMARTRLLKKPFDDIALNDALCSAEEYCIGATLSRDTSS